MKVLHFYKTTLPESMGGIEQFIDQLVVGGMEHGIKGSVLSLTSARNVENRIYNGYDKYLSYQNFEVASTGFSLSVLKKFKKLAEEVDLVHYHFPWPFMDIIHFLSNIKKPTVVTYHSDIIRQKKLSKIYRPLQFQFLSSVDSIVSTSPNYFKTSDVLGFFSKKVSVIPIGLDKEKYPIPSQLILNRYSERFGGKYFLFVGAFRYYKGLHILLDAAKNTNLPIVLVGTGPIEIELKNRAKELGLDNVYFLGQLPEVDKVALIMHCLAVVFPSHLRSEAFGISLLEGAMYGKPMISSEIGTGTTFINIADETGYVVEPNDCLALSDAMTKLWNGPEEVKRMSLNSESRFWSHFTSDTMARSYAALYENILKNA